jgi:hypothetical protein
MPVLIGADDLPGELWDLLVLALRGAAEDVEGLIGVASLPGHQNAFGLLDDRQAGQSSLEALHPGVPEARPAGGHTDPGVVQLQLDGLGGA